MNFIDILMAIMMALTTLYGVYFCAIAVMGTIKKEKPIPPAKSQKRIAALIAARNEENVIGNLVESVLNQNYPHELMDVFVIPNNCTDGTEEAAKAAGARILNCTIPVHAKGEAVSWAIDELLKYPENYDAFVIVDADNLLDPGYFKVCNDALCAGAQVGQGFRDSKNYADSWIAGCSSEFYWCMSRFYNKARSALGMSAALNGTGILLSADYMRKVGWHTSSLTEDLEFTAQCALKGVRIWWLGDARAYDEQPNSFVDSFKQRRRWAAGTVQCMRGYFCKLMKRAICERKLQCLDMAVLFSGPVIQLLSIIPGVYFFIRALCSADAAQITPMIIMTIVGAILSFIALSAGSFAVLKIEKKPVRGQWGTVFGLWLFLVSWVPANLISLFTKPPKWVQIPHERAMSMAELEVLSASDAKGDNTSMKGSGRAL